MIRFLVFFGLLTSIIIITYGCKSAKNQANDEINQPVKLNASIDQIAETRFGQPYTIVWNDDKAFALVTKKIKIRSNDPYPTVRFFIFDKGADEVIYENTEPGGRVVWESNEVVHVSSAIRIPNPEASKSDGAGYRFHVVNRKKFSGKFLKN